MQTITITVNNKENTNFLLNLIKKFNFVKTVVTDTADIIPASKFKSWEEFELGLGLWKGRTITKELLRNKSWRKRI